MPQAKKEDYVSNAPTWPEEVIEEWLANRRGLGWRKNVPRKDVKPIAVTVSPEDHRTLKEWSRLGGRYTPLAQRARIILLAAEGVPDDEIAEQVGVTKPTVVAWKRRYNAAGLDELQSRVKI